MTIKVLVHLLVVYFITDITYCDECDKIPDFELLDKCCDTPDLFMEEFVKDCDDKDKFPNIWAQTECYFKNAGTIVNGKPNGAEMKKKSKPMLANNSEWEPVFNAAVDKCVPEVITKDVETRKRVSEPPFNITNVNTMYLHLVACLDVELLLNSPASARKDDAVCNAAVDYVKKCSTVFPAPYMAYEVDEDEDEEEEEAGKKGV